MRRPALLIFILLAATNPSFASTSRVATILCYHEVDESLDHATIPRRSADGSSAPAAAGNEQRRYTASPAALAAHLDYLESHDFTVVSLAQLVRYLRAPDEPENALPEKAVVITVDDGWLCAYTQIAPELQKRQLPFTLFVYPKIVGRGSHAVTWPQVRELASSGVDVQSHSFTHPFLTLQHNGKVDPASYDSFLAHELVDSRKAIEAATGKPVEFLCYPYGDHDDAVVEAARKAGYTAAVTTERGPITRDTPLLELKRYLVHNDTTLDEFASWLGETPD